LVKKDSIVGKPSRRGVGKGIVAEEKGVLYPVLLGFSMEVEGSFSSTSSSRASSGLV